MGKSKEKEMRTKGKKGIRKERKKKKGQRSCPCIPLSKCGVKLCPL
jgi:hypothetical protein